MSADAPAEPIPCPPCRTTGRVISNLGGSPNEIACPWCDGTGVLEPGHDAQARWRDAAETAETAETAGPSDTAGAAEPA